MGRPKYMLFWNWGYEGVAFVATTGAYATIHTEYKEGKS